MPAGYEAWLCTDAGRRLELLDYDLLSLEYVKAVGNAGYFTVLYGQGLAQELLQVDRMMQIFRRPVGGTLALDFLGFLRYWRHDFSKNNYTITLSGPDQNDLVDRRIVAYPAGSAQATISGAADNGMKDVLDENFVNATDTDRNLDGDFHDFTVQGDASAGATVDKGFSWTNVGSVLEDVAEAALTAGGEIFYRLAVTGIDAETFLPGFQFQTAIGQPGRDLTDLVIFGPEFGNVSKCSLETDYREEVNFVYAGGQGEGTERVIKTAQDDTRINASIWNRREAFTDARNEEDPDAVQDKADAVLAEGRPVRRFEATLLDTEQARYGRDWGLGDKVTVRAFGEQFEGIIRAVGVKLSKGLETISVKVEEEDA